MADAGNPNIAELGKATQFAGGQSGNPKGRPPRPSQAIYARLLALPLDKMPTEELKKLAEKFGNVPVLEAMCLANITAALVDKSLKANEKVLERYEGKVSQEIDLGDAGATHLSDFELVRRIAFALTQPLSSQPVTEAVTTPAPADEPIPQGSPTSETSPA